MAKDVLSQVLITPAVVRAWAQKAREEAADAIATGIKPADIPDEQVEALPDGRLRLHVTLPNGTVLAEMFIEKGQWAWMQG